MAERGGTSARRERLVDVDDVQWHAPEQSLEGAADVDGQRRRPPPWTAGQRDALPDRDHMGVGTRPDHLRALLRLPDQPPALPDLLPRIRGGDDQDAMAPAGQLS